MHMARLEIETPYAEEIAEIVQPETAEHISPRSYAELRAEDDRLLFTARSKDTVSLRAAMNSYLRWLAMANRITEELEKR